MSGGERTLVLWVPDWPVHAYRRERAASEAETANSADPARGAGSGTAGSGDGPVALLAGRRVVACSPAARAEGVRPGLREREARTRCPDLEIAAHDPEVDARRFAPVLAAIERLVPGVDPLRPGLCAMRGRGPSRYYGGEAAAARALIGLASELGLEGARVGVADGLFAAEQAARAASGDPGVEAPSEGVRIVAAGGSPAFLGPLPVTRAAAPAFAEVLHGLGIRTLGAFSALPEEAVRERFGAEGVAAHRRASAAGPAHGAEVRPRAPERELAVDLAFEPPVDTSEQLAFACVSLADRLLSDLADAALVCTSLRVELTDDTGARHERVWTHPRRFTAADAVNRIRWQLDAIPRDPERGGAGIARVRLTPTRTDRAAAHESGLWNTEPDERVHHHLSRVQSRLGHTGVGTAELGGGRLLADRQRFVPWATGQARGRGSRASAAGPWPGALPGPVPSAVFPVPLAAELTDGNGAPLGINGDDLLTARPARLRVDGARLEGPVSDWSLPWALRERWWEGTPERFRLQVQLTDGDAWLLLHEGGHWFAEGHYD